MVAGFLVGNLHPCEPVHRLFADSFIGAAVHLPFEGRIKLFACHRGDKSIMVLFVAPRFLRYPLAVVIG
jgi:hypothetical protein